MGSRAEVAEARAALEAPPGLGILPVSADIAQEAARIRAATGVRLPDAVQLASAIAAGADAFLTNDRRLQRPGTGIEVMVLDDLAAG